MAQAGDQGKFIEFIREVKSRTDLVELVREDANLEQIGSIWKCSSPFRRDDDPSFVIYPDGGWYDFGTQERGDCFSYVQKRDNIDFKEAVAKLALRAGMALYWTKHVEGSEEEKNWAHEAKMLAESTAIFELLTEAADYYHSVLPNKIREEYYQQIYGFADETIDRLRLGYASGNLAANFLEKGYRPEMLLKTGLFFKHGEKIVDIFQDRLFIPYWKENKTVYCIARKTKYTDPDDTNPYEKAKYKKLQVHSEKHSQISPFISNDFFFNEEICSKPLDYLLITEGVTDCIAAIQHGLPCISPVTTKFRIKDVPKLISLIKKSKARMVYLCNDADENEDGRKPGEEGALHTAAALTKEGIEVHICTLPRPEGVAKVDLCEFLRDNGPEPFQVVLKLAKRFIHFLLEQIPTEGLNETELETKLQPLLEAVANLSPISRSQYAKRIAARFKLTTKVVTDQINKYKPEEPKPVPVQNDNAPTSERRRSVIPDKIRGIIYEDIGCYYAEKKDGSADVISSFSLRVKEKMIVDTHILFKCDIEARSGPCTKDFTFQKSAWNSKRDFVRCLPSLHQWTGSDDELQGLLRLLNTFEVPTKRGTTNLGYDDADGEPKWLWPGGIITKTDFSTAGTTVYIPDGANIQDRVKYTQLNNEDVRKLAKEVLPKLFEINTSEVILPLIGWFYSTPFKPRIQRLLGHFPILHIWGTHGSGKSSIVKDIFWPLMGMAGNKNPFGCTDTPFAITKKLGATDSVPLFFDEYKSDMGRVKLDHLHRILRRLYGGEMEERGRQDLSLVGQTLKAPTVLAGEMPVLDDAALSERIVGVSPDPNALIPERKNAFYAVRGTDLSPLATAFIQWSLSQDVPRELEDSKPYLNSLLTKMGRSNPPPRVYDNLLVVVFGMKMFEQWATSLQVELPHIDPLRAFGCITDEILNGEGSHVKDAFDYFIEALSVLAAQGIIEEGIHYSCVEGKLCLSLLVCYDRYLVEQRKRGKEDPTGGISALKRNAHEKYNRLGSYITHLSKQVKMGHGSDLSRLRCIEIDMNMIPEYLNFERFPVTSMRRHGGYKGSSGTGWGPQGGDA